MDRSRLSERPRGQTLEQRAIWLYRRFNTVYLETGRDWHERTDDDKAYWRGCAEDELTSEQETRP